MGSDSTGCPVTTHKSIRWLHFGHTAHASQMSALQLGHGAVRSSISMSPSMAKVRFSSRISSRVSSPTQWEVGGVNWNGMSESTKSLLSSSGDSPCSMSARSRNRLSSKNPCDRHAPSSVALYRSMHAAPAW